MPPWGMPWRYWIGASHLSGGTYRPCIVLRDSVGFSTEYLGTAGVATSSYFHGLDVLDNALNPYAVGVFSSQNWIRVLTRNGVGVWGTSANLTLANHANGIYIRGTNDVMILAHNVANGRDGLYHWDGAVLTYILQLSTAAPFINDGTHRGCLVGVGRGSDCAMFAIGSMGNGVSVGKLLPAGLDPKIAGNWQTIAHPNYATFVADSGYMVSESEIYVGQRSVSNFVHPMVVRWNGGGWVSLGRHTSDPATSQTAGALTMDPAGVLHAHFRWTSGGTTVRGVCKYVGGAWVDVFVHSGSRQMVAGKDVRDGVLAWCGLAVTGDLGGHVLEIRNSGATEVDLVTVLPAVSFKSAGSLSPAAPDPPPPSFTVAEDGGYKVTISGTFPVDTPLEVFIGPAGDATDFPCYGGEGYGYLPQSADGVSLTIVTPPLPVGENYLNWRTVGGALSVWGVAEVVDRHWQLKTYRMRASFPSWGGIGPRGMEGEV